ncbi:HugZ family protein [Cognatishimia sp. F0-27]|uniref:HugZ family pyridoxamine 5'-phosphate oxidase n=1 Tax=Cognatishimia sp. F0-27 TaxID=2816855 RepID=UPI001D0C2E11|nr:pyridoxamine 5'-phosphate oxidase family protein [Cognatishimia sp. F0-27]MCC1492826.1 pyridoxamine 5'-phosphate oxidase family protein [Cognatishimia sp. F0-27]
MVSPIRPTNDDARALGRALIETARFASLAVIDPASGGPLVTRIACVAGPDGMPLSLVSDLSQHTQALKRNPACSMLVGEPGPKGDPLTHPRLSLMGTARFIPHGASDHAALCRHYLKRQPKAKLYIGFADFAFLRLDMKSAHLNGGFGKAFVLTPDDLRPE